jgi:2-succinyl-6-hydroxy-2,4-cyclohexadiene-1-carboxylate synthase
MKDCHYENRCGKLHYLDSQRQNAPTIVFLHGFTGSSRDFFTLPNKIRDRYRCLIPDLPGHGQTQLLETAAVFQTDGQVALLNDWLNSLGQNRFHLCGYSMGGRLALQFAINNSDRLHSLILVSTTAGILEDDSRQTRIAADRELAQKILSADPVEFLTAWLSQPLFAGIVERGQNFIDREVRRRLPIQPSGLASSLQYFSTGMMPSVWHQLNRIQAPTLAIAGVRDEKYTAIATQLVNIIPNATLNLLPTSHAPQIESPDLFWKHILQFLGKAK